MRLRPSRYPMRPIVTDALPAVAHGDTTCGWLVQAYADGSAAVRAWHRHVRLEWAGDLAEADHLEARPFTHDGSVGVALVDNRTGATVAAYRQQLPPVVRAAR